MIHHYLKKSIQEGPTTLTDPKCVNNYLFYLSYMEIIVKGEQTINLQDLGANGQTGQVTDGNGNSGLPFTTQNYFTRGITIQNITDFRVGLKIIVPGVHRMYKKNYKVNKTRSKWKNKIKFGKTNTKPTHWYIMHYIHFLHIWYIWLTYFMREKKDTTENSKP